MTIGKTYPEDTSVASPVVGNVKATPLKSTSVSKWLEALELFDADKSEEALEIFSQITQTNSKIIYNIASIYFILGNYSLAISNFKKATSFDSYMAISHFQIGISRFLSGSYAKAATSFNTALKLLRGNTVVNYQQLGLDYKLYSCEIVYNRALSYIYSGELSTGIFDLGFAAKERKYIPEHSIIDEALTHFKEMEKAQNKMFEEVVTRENVPKLPGALDSRKQRFSVVNPPKNLQIFNNGLSTPQPDVDIFDNLSGEPDGKEVAYSLFSVPQGSLFRLTEIKVRSILNDKSLSEMMMAGRKNTVVGTANLKGNTSRTGGTTFGKFNFLSSPSKPVEIHEPQPHETTKALATQATATTTAGVLTPPISPDLPNTNNPDTKQNSKNDNMEPKSAHTNSAKSPAAAGYIELVEDTRNLLMNPSISRPNGKDKHSGTHMQSSISANSTASSSSLPSPSESMSRSDSFGNSLGTNPKFGVVMAKSGSNGSAHSHGSQNSNIDRNSHTLEQPSGLGLYLGGSNRANGMSHHTQKPPHTKEQTVFEPKSPYHPHHQYAPPQSIFTQKVKGSSSSNPLSIDSASPASFNNSNVYSNSNYDSSISSRASLATRKNAVIKLKIFCGNETRAMKIKSDISFQDLRSRIAGKVQSKDFTDDYPILTTISNNMVLRTKDEDGDLVLIGDQEDLDVAISEAMASSRENPKLGLFVENTFDAEI